MLPPQIRVIQGDGIDYEMAGAILAAVKRSGWSADNVGFGMGGGLLQKLDRDTQEFAFKCSEVRVKGERRHVYKDPVTDHAKRSKPGRLKLVRAPDGSLATVARGRRGPGPAAPGVPRRPAQRPAALRRRSPQRGALALD